MAGEESDIDLGSQGELKQLAKTLCQPLASLLVLPTRQGVTCQGEMSPPQ
jgi:hypothetical protein